MFNLEQSIRAWRCRMATGGIQSPEVLDELESHLRIEIDRLVLSGANEQKAFETAVAQLGEVRVLKDEFAKIQTEDASWLRFLKVFYFGAIAFMILVNSWTLLEYELGAWKRIVGFSFAAAAGWYLLKLPDLLRTLETHAYLRLLKLTKAGMGLIWGWNIYALLQAIHLVHFEVGILPSMILWSLCAVVSLSLLASVLNRRDCRGGHSGLPPDPPRRPVPISPMPPTPSHLDAVKPPRKLSPLAQQALEAAPEEAARLGQDFIGTEHVLLGVLKLAKGAFADFLQNLLLDREIVRAEIERWVSPVCCGAGTISLPLTPRAQRAIQLAANEAKKMDQQMIGAEHLLLGLILEKTGVAGRVLRKFDVRADRTREQILIGLQGHPSC